MRRVILLLALPLLLPVLPAQAASPTTMVAKAATQIRQQAVRLQVETALRPVRRPAPGR